MRAKHSVKVESTEEYKDAINAAEALDLELCDVDASTYGWDSPDSDAIHPQSNFEIKKVGHKYIHFDFGSEGVARAEFGRDVVNGDKAHIRLYFN